MSTHLLLAAAALAAAALLARGPAAPAAETPPGPGPGRPNPFFAMDTATRDAARATPQAQLDLVRDLGFAGVGWTLADAAHVKAVAAEAAQRGLKVFTLYAGAELKAGRLQPDPRLPDALGALRGSDAIVWLFLTSKEHPRSSPDGDAAAVEGLRALADTAADAGLRIALYPHSGFWLERVQDAVRLAAQVRKKNLGVTFNVCHCLNVGDEERIPALLAEAAPHLMVVSVNGADAGAAGQGWGRLIQTLDRGTFDLVPLLARLRELGYQGPIGLQGYGIKGDARDNLSRSMAAWKTLAARAAARP